MVVVGVWLWFVKGVIKMTNYIWITTQKEMFHCYPKAPEEVKFLRNEHRHLFKFKIYLEVYGDNRDVEFIMFKREVEDIINNMFTNLKEKSCEMISNYLHGEIFKLYPDRDMLIEVSEDGENGSMYHYNKQDYMIIN